MPRRIQLLPQPTWATNPPSHTIFTVAKVDFRTGYSEVRIRSVDAYRFVPWEVERYESQYPHPVQWWNVATPTHVLIARDGERENHWAFPVRADERMEKIRQHFDGKDTEEKTRDE